MPESALPSPAIHSRGALPDLNSGAAWSLAMHAHPTMHEAIHEASLACEGRLIHA